MPVPGGVDLVTELSASWIATLGDAALKGTVLLVVAAAATRLMGRAPAAARHLVWTAALVGMLALPALGPVAPGLEVPLLPRIEVGPRHPAARPPARHDAFPAAPAPGFRAVPSPLAADPEGVPAPTGRAAGTEAAAAGSGEGGFRRAGGWLGGGDPLLLLSGAWLLGTLLVLTTLLVGKARIRWLARDADRIRDGPWVELQQRISDHLGLGRRVVLLRGSRPLVPMTWGVFRPRVMLPETADTWSDACRHNVLLHELAHVRRRDCLVRLLARLACALYWFHPLVWHAARRLRLEQEEACDDHVLRAGTLASDYARQLVGMARLLRAVRTPAHAGSTGTGRSDFMRRMRALLDGGRARRPLDRSAAAGLASAAGALVLALASARPAGSGEELPPPEGPARAAAAEDRSEEAAGPETAAEPAPLQLAAVRVVPDERVGPPGTASPGTSAPAGERRTAASPGASRDAPEERRLPGREAPEERSMREREETVPPPAGEPTEPPTPGREAEGEGPAVAPGDLAEEGDDDLAPLRAAFASYWHGAGAATGPGTEVAPEDAAGSGSVGSVATSARRLARELDRLRDPGARADLLRSAVRPGSTRSLTVLMELSFRADRPTDRITAVQALAGAPSGARSRFVYQVARTNPWSEVRAAAVEQLRRLEPERVVPWLVTLVYRDADPAVQRRAVTELASLDREGVDTSLMQIARSHPDADVRLEAFISLLRTGSGQALSKYVENA